MRPASLLAAVAMVLVSATAAAQQVRFDWVRSSGRDPEAAVAPPRANTFRNPVVAGFHPDPSIVRVGQWFYLVNSSFSYYPGLPLFRSRDMVHWQPIGHAFGGAGFPDFAGQGIARGLFAPTLRFDRGRFYIICTLIDRGGSFVISAPAITGPWTRPQWLGGLEGIDPDLFFTADGSAWVAYNGPPPGPPRYDGHRAIWLQRFDRTSWKGVGERILLVDGGVHPERNPIWTEGPHIVKRGPYFYLFAAEGGTAGDHSETIYRSDKIEGPYAPGPENPILTQRDLPPDRPYPIHAAGHADVVEDIDGRWWTVFLATRPYARNLTNMGRETFLAPLTWQDGWPRILPAATVLPWTLPSPRAMPHAAPPRAWADDFRGKTLSLEWQSLRAPVLGLVFGQGLRIMPGRDGLDSMGVPAMLARRQTHSIETVTLSLDTASVQPGVKAGLAVFSDESHYFAITVRRTGGGARIELHRRSNPDESANGTIVASAPLARVPAHLLLRAALRGPDITFAYRAATSPNWNRLTAPTDAAFLASEASNQFTGVMIGPFAQRIGPTGSP